MASMRFEYVSFNTRGYTLISWLLGFGYALCFLFGLGFIFSGGVGILIGILLIVCGFGIALVQRLFNDWAQEKEIKRLIAEQSKVKKREIENEGEEQSTSESGQGEEDNATTEPRKKCTNCGAELVEGALFCNKCGKAIDAIADSPSEKEKTEIINHETSGRLVQTTELDDNKIDNIRKWKMLYDEGIISAEEYEIRRKDILGL